MPAVVSTSGRGGVAVLGDVGDQLVGAVVVGVVHLPHALHGLGAGGQIENAGEDGEHPAQENAPQDLHRG